MEGKTNFSRRLQAVTNRDCWVFGNHWRRAGLIWKVRLVLPDWPWLTHFTTDLRHCLTLSFILKYTAILMRLAIYTAPALRQALSHSKSECLRELMTSRCGWAASRDFVLIIARNGVLSNNELMMTILRYTMLSFCLFPLILQILATGLSPMKLTFIKKNLLVSNLLNVSPECCCINLYLINGSLYSVKSYCIESWRTDDRQNFDSRLSTLMRASVVSDVKPWFHVQLLHAIFACNTLQ